LLCYTRLDLAALRKLRVKTPPSELCADFAHDTAKGQKIERVDVSEPASISSGIAARYATAVFSLASETKKLKAVEGDLDSLEAALADSADFNNLISSPVYSREEQGAAVAGLAKKMKLSPMMTSTLGLMAAKRRLFVLPQLVRALRAAIAQDKGEVAAEVVSAKALTKTQSDKLAKTLKERFGKTVTINATVDETLIGGLVVKVGSKMIDTSIRSQLSSLQNAMKEVG
jgi:F-type H+-transporting ATPase subunit delta